MRPAVFLDRDGVLNEDSADPIVHPDQIILLPGAADAVRRINDAGLPVVIATNQAVVARGLASEAQLARIHDRLRQDLARQSGARLDAIYYCPHHPAPDDSSRIESYCIECECRKPEPGLLLRAARELDLDLGGSFFIGDSTRDALAGKRAGVATILLTHSGNQGRDGIFEVTPDFIAPGLEEAVELALRNIITV